jgi:formylglycine-generating enzyme required for sulfatase activity
MEHDCDHLGVLLAARAGFDVRGAAELWRRKAGKESWTTPPPGGRYPSHAERYASLAAVVEQVTARKAAGLPILPGHRDPDIPPRPQPAPLPELADLLQASAADPAGTQPTPDTVRPTLVSAPLLPPPPPVGKSGPAFRDCASCPEMVPLPAGAFDMGDLDGKGYAHERPVRRVSFAGGLALGKYEVTQAEWRAVMGANPSRFVGDRNPVENVTWEEAKEYARRLAAKTGKPYRLPSEAEWEYAARAGSRAAYPWGNTITRDQARYYEDGGTRPVGSYQPNAFGLHDTAGNVWEWVEDCWSASHADVPADGAARERAGCDARVNRGGSWGRNANSLRSAYREWAEPGVRSSTLGFRVARGM